MKILHLHAMDEMGAAISALRFHQNLQTSGLESHFLAFRKTTPGTLSAPLQRHSGARLTGRILNKVFYMLFKRDLNDQVYHFKFNLNLHTLSTREILASTPFTPDIIIAHWISDAYTYKHLYELKQRTGAPVILYLVDMAHMTGGCHYAYDCEGYLRDCKACPAISAPLLRHRAHRHWQQKKHYLDRIDPLIVTPTDALDRQAKQSSLLKDRRIEFIMLGVDETVFTPGNRQEARKTLGLPPDKTILFFGAQLVEDKRKGMELLIEALQIVKGTLANGPSLRDNIFMAIAGRKLSSVLDRMPFPYEFLGYLDTPDALAGVYQAADFFICPSIEDSGPVMINEAVMCGRPVVAFDMGVAPDLVHTGQTGYRCPQKNAQDLAAGILSLLEMSGENKTKMEEACRALALSKTSAAVQIKNFKTVFQSLGT